MLLGRLLTEQKDWAGAAEVYEQLAEAGGSSTPTAMFNVGRMQTKLGQPEKGYAAYTAAVTGWREALGKSGPKGMDKLEREAASRIGRKCEAGCGQQGEQAKAMCAAFDQLKAQM